MAIFGTASIPQATDNPPPFWAVAVIPFIFFAGFLPIYLKRFPETRANATSSPWKASPLRFFTDPLPFYHLCVWAGLIGGFRTIIDELIHPGTVEMSVAWFSLAAGFGCLIGVSLARESLKTKKDGEPAR